MNFGAEFDDDVFERPRGKRANSPPRRGAKILYPKWFLDPAMKCNSEEEEQQCLRHKADFMYYSKNYSEAASLYERFLLLVPESNIPCRRECMENISHCFLHSDCPDRALEWALKLHAIASNADQKVLSLNLLATVCHALHKYEEELESLHSCLESHKSNPDLWCRLAYCYSGMFKIPLPTSDPTLVTAPYCCDFKTRLASKTPAKKHTASVDGDVSVQHDISEEADNAGDSCPERNCLDPKGPKDEENGKCEMCILGVQMVSACFIRARILTSNVEKEHLCSEKYSQMNQEITDCLNFMEVEQSFIDEASNMLKSEMGVGIQIPSDTSVT